MRTIVGGDVMEGGYGGHSGMWGLWVFAFLIIFFIVLVFMWHKPNHDGDSVGKLAGLLPLLGLGHYNGCHKHDEDLRVEQAHDTGKIIHDIDLNSKYLESKIDRNLLESKEDKLRELERKHIEEQAKWLQERTENAIARSEAFTNYRLDHIQSCMVKEPKFVAHGTHETYYNGNSECGR